RFQIAAQDLEFTFARQIFTQQQAQERRLARTARAGQEDEIAFVDGQGQVAQRVDAAAVKLGKMIGLYQLRDVISRFERTLEQIVDTFRVRLPARGLHDFADEEAERRRLAAAV